jgi:hypothetical protein
LLLRARHALHLTEAQVTQRFARPAAAETDAHALSHFETCCRWPKVACIEIVCA